MIIPWYRSYGRTSKFLENTTVSSFVLPQPQPLHQQPNNDPPITSLTPPNTTPTTIHKHATKNPPPCPLRPLLQRQNNPRSSPPLHPLPPRLHPPRRRFLQNRRRYTHQECHSQWPSARITRLGLSGVCRCGFVTGYASICEGGGES